MREARPLEARVVDRWGESRASAGTSQYSAMTVTTWRAPGRYLRGLGAAAVWGCLEREGPPRQQAIAEDSRAGTFAKSGTDRPVTRGALELEE